MKVECGKYQHMLDDYSISTKTDMEDRAAEFDLTFLIHAPGSVRSFHLDNFGIKEDWHHGGEDLGCGR